MATETSTEDRVIDAALDLAASQGWRGLGLREIAAAAGVGLAELYDAFPGKDAILDGYEEFADFDYAELALIEPLRTLRMLHYAAWISWPLGRETR